MIALVAASLLLRQTQAANLPKSLPTNLPAEVLDWPGFRYLPAGPRSAPNLIPTVADWSGVKGDVAPNAAVWRTKVVVLERMDRVHERGPDIVWPGHYGLLPPVVARIKRALPQFRALVADETAGAVDLRFDLVEEAEAISVSGGDLQAAVQSYLYPRINGGRYEAEDGVYRGPYQSVIVIHPLGGESSTVFEVQGAPVAPVGLPDVNGAEADGVLAVSLLERWRDLASRRAQDAGLPFQLTKAGTFADWRSVLQGLDSSTDERLHLLATPPQAEPAGGSRPQAFGPRGEETTVKITKDPARGSVLAVEEAGYFRSGGVALPVVEGQAIDTAKSPTLSFWMKSEAKDPIVLQFRRRPEGSSTRSIRIGTDVPFVYDGTWRRVKIDLRSIAPAITGILIAPDAQSKATIRDTIGPIAAYFSDFETTIEPVEPKPEAEAPSATSPDPMLRARWAASAGPGDARRALLRDPVEAVKANAVAAAFARPDPADEPLLIEDSLYTFEPTVFTPALRALDNLKTPTARDALRKAVRIAAADRARGFAAELLAASGDEKLVPEFVGLNQARTSAARLSAIRALGRISGKEAALMRMAYLPQNDPGVKLEATKTADPNDDYQGRKLLWSAVNEPSDAVRLESLRRLSYSTVPEFRAEGLKGIKDDSVGVRVGLLQAWTLMPNVDALPAIYSALADPSPRTRAAATDALAASTGPINAKGLPFDDPEPRVQLALLRLSATKRYALPQEVLERMRKSPDPLVRSAAVKSP